MVRWAGADIQRCGDRANVAARHHALITINSVTATAGHWVNKYIFTRDFIEWTFPILSYSELLVVVVVLLVGIVGTLPLFVHLFIPWLLFAI